MRPDGFEVSSCCTNRNRPSTPIISPDASTLADVRAALADLGDDASELGVQVDLGRHHARHDVEAAEHQRRGGLVAARLDPEDERSTGHDASSSESRIQSSRAEYSG